MFYIQNIKPSNIVVLKTNKIEFIITDGLELFNPKTGKIFDKLGNIFELIEKIYTYDRKILAVKRDSKLLKYDPIRDDSNLFYIKQVNHLLTFEELKQELKAKDIYIGLMNVTYKPINQTLQKKLKIFGGTKVFKTDYGYYLAVYAESHKSPKGLKYATGKKNNVQINIYRYYVDTKKELFLYHYSITPCIL